MSFTVFVFSAALLNAPVSSPAAGLRSKRIPLNLYTSEACNEKGVNYAYYEGTWGNLPDFDKLKPVQSGKLKEIDLSPRKRDESFGIRFTGYLKVETAGVFEFFLTSDDGSRLYIDSKVVVDNGGTHGMTEKVGNADLSEGVHAITLTYFNATSNDRGLRIVNCMPLPWHVKEAEIRIPVDVSLENAWGRMPPQAYLADLNPAERKELNFDPKTKSAVLRDVRSKEDKERIVAELKERCRKNNQEYKPEFYRLHGNPIMRVKGSATYTLQGEYKWFSFRSRGHAEVHVDGKKVPEVVGWQDGIHPGDHRFPTYKREGATVVRIPPGGKKLTIKVDSEWVKQAGFLTRGPTVARTALYLTGYDSTSLIPLVHDTHGERVGCRILWAHPGEPMSILFDCSSGEKQYLVYLVDRSKKPDRLTWVPKAGLIFESRYPNRYDPAVKTVDGFLELWDAADVIAGKKEMARIWKGFFPFRPPAGTTPNYRDVLRGARMELSSYTGFFHVPDTQKYQFHFKTEPGGYFLIDNQLVSQFKYHEARELEQKGSREGYQRFAVELEKGMHRLEFCQYGSAERFSTRLGWGLPGKETDLEPLGNAHHSAAFSVWEPIADAGAQPINHRQRELHASFTWQRHRDHFHRQQWWGKYPGRDIILLSFAARLPKKPGGAFFRWRFDDGHTAVGESVEHFFLSPGIRTVQLDVLDGPGGKVIASTSSKVHAHVNWAWPQDGEREEIRAMIVRRAEEFASVTPIEEVVSLYYWARQNHWPARRKILGSALAQRADDVIEKYPYTRLLEMAQTLGAPREAHYDAAEKFLRAAMDRAPAGSRHWRAATLALAEILVSARAKPKEGLELVDKLQRTRPTIDLTGNWQMAEAKQWHALTATDGIPGVPEGLNWSNAALPFDVRSKEGRGIWLAKDIDLPASRKGKELVLALGDMPGSGVIWFNGKRVGRPWQWPGGNIVIPAGMQRAGGKNRFAALFQPTDPPGYFAGRPAPTLRASGPPNVRAGAYLEFPMVFYTSKSCTERGVDYAYYEGKWDKLPDFDKMKPVKKGRLKTIDLSPRTRDEFFAMKFTGYLKVTSAGAFTFHLAADNGSRLYIDSKMVIDNDGNHNMGEKKQGEIHLAEGVHSVTLTYYQKDGERGLNITLPNTFLSAMEVATRRGTVDALLGMGEEKKARVILMNLNPHAWPIPEKTRLKLTSDLRRTDSLQPLTDADAAAALDTVNTWLHKHPMLRMDPEFMAAKIEAYVEMGDYDRAFTLAGQMRHVDMNEHQLRQLMLVQVKSRIKAGQMEAARKVYGELKKIAPYSTATVEAREAIRDAILNED